MENRRLADQLSDALKGLQDSLAAAREALSGQCLDELERHLDSASAATRRARESQQRLKGDEPP